jgi:hypothetical protein
MKKIKLMCVAFIGIMATAGIQAQNYKAPTIDASGKVTVAGKYVGEIKDSTIANHEGGKIAIIGSDGMLIDHKTGKKLGKAEKNGNFVYFEGNEQWTLSEPNADGYCEVKDKTGTVVGMVHENYKQQGACAIHCLIEKREEPKK